MATQAQKNTIYQFKDHYVGRESGKEEESQFRIVWIPDEEVEMAKDYAKTIGEHGRLPRTAFFLRKKHKWPMDKCFDVAHLVDCELMFELAIRY